MDYLVNVACLLLKVEVFARCDANVFQTVNGLDWLRVDRYGVLAWRVIINSLVCNMYVQVVILTPAGELWDSVKMTLRGVLWCWVMCLCSHWCKMCVGRGSVHILAVLQCRLCGLHPFVPIEVCCLGSCAWSGWVGYYPLVQLPISPTNCPLFRPL